MFLRSYSAILLLLVSPRFFSEAGGVKLGSRTVARMTKHGSCPEDSSFRTALKLTEPLPFCDEYRDKACCSPETAREIRETVHEIVRPECSACFKTVKSWKCAECHPDAGDFHVGQRASILFCEDFCHAVFNTCSDIPLDLERGYFYLNEPEDMVAEEWCQGRIAEEGQCFRGYMPTESERTEVDECQCEDHDCHDEAIAAFEKAQAEAKKQAKPMNEWQEPFDEL